MSYFVSSAEHREVFFPIFVQKKKTLALYLASPWRFGGSFSSSTCTVPSVYLAQITKQILTPKSLQSRTHLGKQQRKASGRKKKGNTYIFFMPLIKWLDLNSKKDLRISRDYWISFHSGKLKKLSIGTQRLNLSMSVNRTRQIQENGHISYRRTIQK